MAHMLCSREAAVVADVAVVEEEGAVVVASKNWQIEEMLQYLQFSRQFYFTKYITFP